MVLEVALILFLAANFLRYYRNIDDVKIKRTGSKSEIDCPFKNI
jgi:hypothetical protein